MELPYNAQAEKQVLANMIFSSDMLVETFSRLDEEDFYVNEHKIIFKALREIFENNNAKVEPFALIDKLSIDGNLDKVGDASYILELVDSYIDIANAKYYINSVEEKAILRKLIQCASNITSKWQSESSGDIASYINKIERDITDITKKRRVEDFVSITEAFAKYKERLSLIRVGQDDASGLMTGFSTFDKLMLGFKPGEISILAARPSVGKSALSLNFLFRTAMKTKKPCVFFSLEMGVDSVTTRILAAKSGVPIRKIQTAMFDKQEEEKAKRISPIFIMPEYRNKGFAQKAIQLAEEIHGFSNWELDTILQEKGNCYLYEKMGYYQTGKTEKINEKLNRELEASEATTSNMSSSTGFKNTIS